MVAYQVNEVLQETGQMRMAELALRFSLSADILNKAIQTRMGAQLDAHMEGGLLYTPTYVSRLTAQVQINIYISTRKVSRYWGWYQSNWRCPVLQKRMF